MKLLGFLFVTPQFVSSSRIRFTYVTYSKDKTKTLKQLPAKCFYEIKKSRLILQNWQGKKCLYPSIFLLVHWKDKLDLRKCCQKDWNEVSITWNVKIYIHWVNFLWERHAMGDDKGFTLGLPSSIPWCRRLMRQLKKTLKIRFR